jgi:methionyl aminopeptidase
MGSNKPVMWPDNWTMATADGKPTAQFEHTLLITETGVEELTKKLPTSPKYSWEI